MSATRIAAILIDEILLIRSGDFETLRHRVVCLRIGAAKSVDRLLRIADDDRLSINVRARCIARDPLDDLGLCAIGVLKFVDEDEVVLASNAFEHVCVIEHGERAKKEIIEVDDAETPLFAIEIVDEAAGEGVKRHRRAMGCQALMDGIARVAGAQNFHGVANRISSAIGAK